jgi:hypothetical protein
MRSFTRPKDGEEYAVAESPERAVTRPGRKTRLLERIGRYLKHQARKAKHRKGKER